MIDHTNLYLSFTFPNNEVETRCLQQSGTNYEMISFGSVSYFVDLDYSSHAIIFAANTKAGQNMVD